MSSRLAVVFVSTLVALVLMLLEWRVSRRNEVALRRAGAVEPAGDVHGTMAWAYPASFVAMALEGILSNRPPGVLTLAGAAGFAAAKALKYWAMASLGRRWSFRVLVLPGAPLVTRGPYAWLRHPNYVGVIGELAAFALLVSAPVTGIVAVGGFALLIRARIRVEERALGIAPAR
jgi:methyltransferase